MKITVLAVATLAFALTPLSCNIVGGSTGCDFRKGSVNGPEPRCQERNGVQAGEAFAATCSGLQGEALDGGCPETGIVAGCDISGDGTVIDWYYAPKTQADVEKDCADDDGTVVSP